MHIMTLPMVLKVNSSSAEVNSEVMGKSVLKRWSSEPVDDLQAKVKVKFSKDTTPLVHADLPPPNFIIKIFHNYYWLSIADTIVNQQLKIKHFAAGQKRPS